jgi:hypothetical protein
MSVDCQLGRLYGHGPGGDCAGLRRHEGRSPAEIVNVCGSQLGRLWGPGSVERDRAGRCRPVR